MAERPLRVLIIGGYGTFGGRLARLLADDRRLHLIVAGRSSMAAQKLCADLPPGAGRQAARFDRDGDVAAQLATLAPDVTVDASGPFQAYGADPYCVVRACIAQGAHYLDLADGSEFVAGISAFDAAARDAGVFVLAGASSFPVLTAAVVRRLAPEMARIEHVAAGIAPSPYAGFGSNVVRAIAGYAGKPIARLQWGRPVRSYPLIETRSYVIRPPGVVPLWNRRFSLVDVPDLRVIPELWPELRSIWVGAGPVPEILQRGLNLLAWLVRLRLLASLTPLAPLFQRVINVLRWGEHRGGMFVHVGGRDEAGKKRSRSWYLVAEGDDGPLIPSLAAVGIVRRMLSGRQPEPGARAATLALDLADYEALFAGLGIRTGVRNQQAESEWPLYRRMMGEAWNSLPPAVRAAHDSKSRLVLAGQAAVERGRGVLAAIVAGLMRFPRPGVDIPVTVRFEPASRGEIWHRDFAGRRFSSVQTAGSGDWLGLIEERFGPVRVALACALDGERLRLIVRAWSLFGVAMPRFLSPGGYGVEWEENGRFNFDVEITAPLAGRLVRYRGWLAPQREAA